MPDPDRPDEAPPPAPPPPPPGDFPPMPPAPAPDRIRALIEGDGGRAK
jgi:hypothetical protein